MILRTKKRLSDNRWYLPVVALGFIGLSATLVFALRASSLASAYGVVPVEFPVLPVAVTDEAFHTFEETTGDELSAQTPAVILTTEAFYFGDMAAFSSGFYLANNKFVVRHEGGTPQLGKLIETMERWQSSRKAKSDNLVVFLPAGNIPAPIVIQVIAGLRDTSSRPRVVLASGLM